MFNKKEKTMDINKERQLLAEQVNDEMLDLEAPIYMGYTDEELEEMIRLASVTDELLTDDELAELFDI